MNKEFEWKYAIVTGGTGESSFESSKKQEETGCSCYAASKGGLWSATKSYAKVLGEYNINVNAVFQRWLKQTWQLIQITVLPVFLLVI